MYKIFLQVDLSGTNDKHLFHLKADLQGNIVNKSPQPAESPHNNGNLVIRSPKSPDYPPKVSVRPTSPTSAYTYLANNMLNSFVVNSSEVNQPATDNNNVEGNNNAVRNLNSTFHRLETELNINSSKYIKSGTHDTVRLLSTKERVLSKYLNETRCAKEQLQQSEIVNNNININIGNSVGSPPSPEINKTPAEPTTPLPPLTPQSNNKSPWVQSSTTKDRRSSKEHPSAEKRQQCPKCHKRSKIRKANVGVQCRRDKNLILPNYCNSVAQNRYKGANSDNMRLNLQTKHNKLLAVKSEASPFLDGLKYKDFIHIETYPNGGATVVHMYQDEIDVLSPEQLEELAREYFEVFSSY